MTVKLRLMRVGKKKQPTYRIVATDSRAPRDGRFIEIVGTYAPRSDPSQITVKGDKAMKWLSQGAQPTETVRKLLEISGVWGEFQSSKTPKAPPPPRSRPGRATKAAPAQRAAAAKGA
ncbi:MAG: 30S ribosomal protein S16 [Acidimicrobiales bacterium]